MQQTTTVLARLTVILFKVLACVNSEISNVSSNDHRCVEDLSLGLTSTTPNRSLWRRVKHLQGYTCEIGGADLWGKASSVWGVCA